MVRRTWARVGDRYHSSLSTCWPITSLFWQDIIDQYVSTHVYNGIRGRGLGPIDGNRLTSIRGIRIISTARMTGTRGWRCCLCQGLRGGQCDQCSAWVYSWYGDESTRPFLETSKSRSSDRIFIWHLVVQCLHRGIIGELHTCLSFKNAYISFSEIDKFHHGVFSFVSSQRA
jgi:hypothetical protein